MTIEKNSFGNYLNNLPNFYKITLLILSDLLLCAISIWLAYCIRLDAIITLQEINYNIFIFCLFFSLIFFFITGIYKLSLRYFGRHDLIKIFINFFFYGLFTFFVVSIITLKETPRSVGLLQPLIFLFLFLITRLFLKFAYDYFKNYSYLNNKLKKYSIIYGAGKAGIQLASALENSNASKVIAYIDDNPNLLGKRINGTKVYSFANLSKLIKKKNISEVFFAIPSLETPKRLEIINKILKLKIKVKTLPSISDLLEKKISISDIKDLDIEDILSREQIPPIQNLLKKNIYLKTVLVTGAGGSIGSELCKQVVKIGAKKLILIDSSEYALFRINDEINKLKILHNSEIEVFAFLTSISNPKRLDKIFEKFKPDTVYHSAAYKHVTLVEQNIIDGLINNVFGTLNVVEKSFIHKVRNFVLVSSDKAVNPSNIMGASKRCSELIVQSFFENKIEKITSVAIVRFGNVIASSGSIIPMIKKQIEERSPLTLTHPEVSRYFMSIPEAAQLVIQAGSMSLGNEVFILDMGQPLKIIDLMRQIILHNGLLEKNEENPDGDIEIKIIGLRPGEKLHEELFLGKFPQKTEHPKIQRSAEPFLNWNDLKNKLLEMKIFIENGDIKKVVEALNKIVPEYYCKDKLSDLLL